MNKCKETNSQGNGLKKDRKRCNIDFLIGMRKPEGNRKVHEVGAEKKTSMRLVKICRDKIIANLMLR